MSSFLLPASRGFFITGTDTGVGKTRVACLLVDQLKKQGLRVAVMKPVAAGVEVDGLNEDVSRLMDVSNVVADLRDVNPYVFELPVAPHIAASHAGVEIDLEVIARSYARLQEVSDVVVVEGAGGFLVPLDANRDMSAIPAKLALPVVLVVGMRLGCLNHALLTHEAISARGLQFSGWIANEIAQHMPFYEENIKTLKSSINAPLLANLAWSPG